MRISAPCARPWQVYHCTQARMLDAVRWVDDVLLQWNEIDIPATRAAKELRTITHQASAIRIMVDRGLVLIDPIVDRAFEIDQVEVGILQRIAEAGGSQRLADKLDAMTREILARPEYRPQDARMGVIHGL